MAETESQLPFAVPLETIRDEILEGVDRTSLKDISAEAVRLTSDIPVLLGSSTKDIALVGLGFIAIVNAIRPTVDPSEVAAYLLGHTTHFDDLKDVDRRAFLDLSLGASLFRRGFVMQIDDVMGHYYNKQIFGSLIPTEQAQAARTLGLRDRLRQRISPPAPGARK